MVGHNATFLMHHRSHAVSLPGYLAYFAIR